MAVHVSSKLCYTMENYESFRDPQCSAYSAPPGECALSVEPCDHRRLPHNPLCVRHVATSGKSHPFIFQNDEAQVPQMLTLDKIPLTDFGAHFGRSDSEYIPVGSTGPLLFGKMSCNDLHPANRAHG